MSSPITESQSNMRRHAIQSVVNDEPDCYFVRSCFPSLVATVDSNDCYSEAVHQLENIAGAYMDGIFVVGTTQRAGAIRRKIQRVFEELNIEEPLPAKIYLKKCIEDGNNVETGAAEHITQLEHRVTDLSTEVGDIKGSVGRMEDMLKSFLEKV
jgi:hypothetical protein